MERIVGDLLDSSMPDERKLYEVLYEMEIEIKEYIDKNYLSSDRLHRQLSILRNNEDNLGKCFDKYLFISFVRDLVDRTIHSLHNYVYRHYNSSMVGVVHELIREHIYSYRDEWLKRIDL